MSVASIDAAAFVNIIEAVKPDPWAVRRPMGIG